MTFNRMLVPSLYASGSTLVALSLGASTLGLTTSAQLGWPEAALLIVGCDLIVAALAASAWRIPRIESVHVDLTWLLAGAIADGVMFFAIVAAAVITLFGNSKPIERVDYFLAILVLVPLCVTLALRRRRTESQYTRRPLVAYAKLASTAGVLCLARLLGLPASHALGTSLFLLLALLASRIAITLSLRVIPNALLCRLPASTALATAPAVVALGALPFIPGGAFTYLDITAPLLAGTIAFYLVRRGDLRPLPRICEYAVDACVVTISTLVVICLTLPAPGLVENHDFFLGPTLDVLHGHPMLVSTFSQYGVGIFYALAAVFLVVPLGYGTFTLLLAFLTALFFVAFYVVLRWSTNSVFVAIAGLTTAVVLVIFGQIDFYTYVPSTGVMRFGLAWLVVFCSVAATRSPRHRRLLDGLVPATVAVAAVWSGEAGIYCLGTASALACLSAASADGSARERTLKAIRAVGLLVAAWAGSVLAFTLVMRVATGVLPDWGGYLEYIQLYTLSGFGEVPIEPWSPGLVIGALYTVSAIAIVLLVTTRPALVRERAASFRAATGLTALGALVYTYFLGRSAANNLIHISPPAVALVFVWFDLARSTLESRSAVAAASATMVFLCALTIAGESRNISQKYRATALASVLGVSPPLGTQLRALWQNPVAYPTAARVVRFVESLGDRQADLTLLLNSQIETEALLRLGRANAVGSSNPAQESLSRRAAARARAAIRLLAPGGIIVLSSIEPVLQIEQETLHLFQQRFALRQIATGPEGLLAYRMVVRLAAASHRA